MLMIGSVVFSAERSDRLTILVKSVHNDFPAAGVNSAELLVFPKEIDVVLDLDDLRQQIAAMIGLPSAEEMIRQALRSEEQALGGLLPNFTLSMLSFAIRHGLGIPYKKSSLKVLVPVSQLQPNPASSLERLLPFRPEPLVPSDYYQKILEIPGISGEWFVGTIRGVVSHVVSGLGEGVSPRTGLITQASSPALSYTTAFLLQTGYTLVPSSIRLDIPLKDGEVILLRGWVEREQAKVRVSTILKISSLEMWSLI